jgi:hypothetical protein
MSDKKDYLGDGVYVDVYVDGESILLTTENGIEVQNSIVLEPAVYNALLRWVARWSRPPVLPTEDHQQEGWAKPIGKCGKCQTPIYSVEGFCGVCNPEKR